MSISDLKTDLTFSNDEFNMINCFEGDAKVTVMEKILESKLKLLQIQNERLQIQNEKMSNTTNSITTFFKELVLATVNGIDKIPDVIESYNKLKQLENKDSEKESEQ